MMKNKLLNSLILAALAAPGLAMAADAPAVTDPATPHMAMPSTPTFGNVLDASGVSINGYLDTAYSHLSGTGLFTSGTANRVFDTQPNSFNLQQAAITIAKQPKEGFGGLVNLTLGQDANVINSYGGGSGNAYAGVAGTSNSDLTQAFMQYATGNLTAIAGKFVTAAGAEVINSTSNTNYSRSILFGYAIPFSHTGVRATYAMNDQLSLFAGLNNGWDQVKDANKQKTVELGGSYMPNKMFMLSAVDYNGTEQVAGTPGGAQGKRNLLDLVGTLTVSDSLNFVLNPDFGSQENATLANGSTGTAKWSGLAAYANYQINDPWSVSVRGETFKDTDGYRTGVAQTWKEATVTVGYAASKNTELRGELRKDFSDVASFAYSDGIARKGQNSVALEALYKF